MSLFADKKKTKYNYKHTSQQYSILSFVATFPGVNDKRRTYSMWQYTVVTTFFTEQITFQIEVELVTLVTRKKKRVVLSIHPGQIEKSSWLRTLSAWH